ncbi:SpoIIE family protein phosphatase [Microcoleus sp. FACHB-1515]|uniref:SpoIIE family protein phosphatase n=1 Tax=Cyanophyceae TaxID=3028117 RepID=UPI001681EA45|nr:SpoIIE family protein phosphatase [Microcoleus sp. FACHB-1515]MBD2089175.1 SpoIIE family protein phosphatase [Microcoleus sp. FACHB-1515]
MALPEKSKLRLMVVDDESDNLDLLYRTFRRDFEVFKAASALEALQILDRVGEMSIIISDQRMPKMSGIEFLSRTVEAFPDTIRIVLTGYTDVEDLVSAINTGKVFKYITKPWNPDELRSVVQQAAETYQVLKHRTIELRRALRRESLFNAVTTAIRESLDYRSMLQTIASAIGQTFGADTCILRPVETVNGTAQYRLLPEAFSYSLPSTEALVSIASLSANAPVELLDAPCLTEAEALRSVFQHRQIQLSQCSGDHPPRAQLFVPLTYQQELLAVLMLYRNGPAPPWTSEEIELLNGVAEQAALAISQAKLYQRIQQQTEQMRSELAVAHQIQSNLLRQQLPELDAAKVQACCYPAREVGGDFFEVYQHPQGDLWLAVGDVSGKGVPAALFMASAISVLRRELGQETSPEPDIVMQHLNSSLSDNLVGSNCFITIVLARYRPTSGQLCYANAGHIYPLVWSRTETQTPTYLKVRGVPLGILPVWKAPAGEVTLRSNDILLLASDGITEATVVDANHNGKNAMLQQEGLWRLLQQQAVLDLPKLLSHIQSHTEIQEDDQTILALEVL